MDTKLVQINPSGFSGLISLKMTLDYILEQTIKAEKIIKKFIDEIKREFDLTNNKICLSGFSQGCMISLNVGLTSEEKFSCIVGFSGKIIDQNNLKIKIKKFILILY